MAKVVFVGDEKPPDSQKTEADQIITHMKSEQNELIPLIKPVDPNAGKKKGNVEIWLLELESAMRLTVKETTYNAMEAYKKTERKQWIMEWAGQVILSIGGLYWTEGVETALRDRGLPGIKDYFEQLTHHLNDIVILVRGKLSKLRRKALGSLVVVDVHQKDVVQELVEKEVEDATDFLWMSQLRYYWEDKPDDYNRYGTDP